ISDMQAGEHSVAECKEHAFAQRHAASQVPVRDVAEIVHPTVMIDACLGVQDYVSTDIDTLLHDRAGEYDGARTQRYVVFTLLQGCTAVVHSISISWLMR